MNVKTEITFLNITSKVDEYLTSIGRKYYRDFRKERNAINEFMMQGVQPLEVFELVKKLVAVRNHKQNRTDKFWIGATENIYGALAYKNQIETVYDALFASEIQKKSESKSKTWESFIAWAKKSLPPDTSKDIDSIIIDAISLSPSGNSIYISKCSDNIWRFIEKYFEDSGVRVVRYEERV